MKRIKYKFIKILLSIGYIGVITHLIILFFSWDTIKENMLLKFFGYLYAYSEGGLPILFMLVGFIGFLLYSLSLIHKENRGNNFRHLFSIIYILLIIIVIYIPKT